MGTVENWIPVARTPETWTPADAAPPDPTDPEEPPPLQRPVNTVLPAITGTASVGSTLSCSTGTWSNDPTAFAYQWRRGGVVISGEVSATYVVLTGDQLAAISCDVTATNAAGGTTVSAEPVTIAQLAPVNITIPQISGTFDANQTLTCSNGVWANNPTSFAFQWRLSGVAITGATLSTYLVQAADRNGQLSCTVTATNAAGSASATSVSISAVLRRTPVVIFS